MYMMSISQENHQTIRRTYRRSMKILLITVIFLFPTIISASNSFYASALNGFNEENFEKAIKYLEDNYKKILIDSQRFRLVDDSLMELYWETDRQVLVDGHDIDHFLSLLVKENGKYMVLIQRLLDLDFNDGIWYSDYCINNV